MENLEFGGEFFGTKHSTGLLTCFFSSARAWLSSKSQLNQSFTGRQYASMTCDVRTGGREGETIKQAILVKILVLSNKTNEAPNGQLDMSMAVACRSPPSDPSTSTNY